MNICVFCASSEKIDKSYILAGEDFGESLAERGHTLVFGAGKYGVMGAVARGLRRRGGRAIGVIPNFFEEVDVMFSDCEIVRTETMRERKRIMEDMGDAFVVMPGGIGTFEEFFEILTLKQLGRHKKPIIIYNVNGFYDNMLRMLDVIIEERFMTDKCRALFKVCDTAEEIFAYLEEYEPFTYNKYEFLQNADINENNGGKE